MINTIFLLEIGDDMTANSIIKKQARGYLQGGYACFAAALFVLLIPLSIANALETVVVFFDLDSASPAEISNHINEPIIVAVYGALLLAILIIFALSLPLLSGFFKMAANAANGKKVSCRDLFFFFEKGRYACALRFNLSLVLRKLLWLVIAFLPGVLVACLQKLELFSSFSWAFTFIGVLFMSLGIAAFIALSVKYFLAQYLFVTADGSEEQAKNAVALSVKLMKGNKKKYFSLLVSFMPWIVLTFFILPALFTVPYMMVSFADSAKWLCADVRQ
ncbi:MULTISPECIES: DUF975 family protein [unclassified Ruminococcus]|uniref:DUF975 family protein n=1 Tax=unclassified Ruminococcus TaxID=2608920 RepID=UPI0021094DB4|nr:MULTISPECIES: DUF975 family protein [unclassified Ruminococcus]MCQ4023186.1 DUF975 family protein [Ruminococcus sp. zg-924]MCQ4115404.1 DUF975 family protein [Ruminococcus sp. zg-921]